MPLLLSSLWSKGASAAERDSSVRRVRWASKSQRVGFSGISGHHILNTLHKVKKGIEDTGYNSQLDNAISAIETTY